MCYIASKPAKHAEIMDYMMDQLSSAKNSSKILSFVVIGGMSFHGAKIANYLHDMNFIVTVIEDAVNIEPDPLKWYRWTQLPMKNQDKIFIDFSLGTDKLRTKLQAINPDVILYVPTGIIDLNSVQGDPVKIYQLGSATVGHFETLLSIIPKLPSIQQKVILLSTMDNKETNLIYKTWMSSLEQLIYFYGKGHQLVDTTLALIKVNGVFGPWKETIKSSIRCWYIDSIAQLVLYMSNRSSDASSIIIRDLTNKCERDIKSGNTATDLWMDNYELSLKKKKRNVIAGGVLIIQSKARWYQTISKNDHKYLKRFILTAMNHKPDDIVIIHNCYSNFFISKYKNACPSCHFVKYSPVNKRIAHDQRFYMIYDYLLNNPDIGNLVTTDAKDVYFFNDPFKIMAEIGDYFYTSYDIPFVQHVGRFPWLALIFKKCYPDFKNEEEVLNLYGIFNSGIMGGSRHVMLSLLSRILLYLDTASLSAVCDMTTANAVYHTHYYGRIYSGYPFSGSFLLGVRLQQGAAVTHRYGRLFNPSWLVYTTLV